MATVWCSYSAADESEFRELERYMKPLLDGVEYGLLPTGESQSYPNLLKSARVLLVFASGNWLRDQTASDALLIGIGADVEVFWIDGWSTARNSPTQNMVSQLAWKSRLNFKFNLAESTPADASFAEVLERLAAEVRRKASNDQRTVAQDDERLREYKLTSRYTDDLPYLGLYKYTEEDSLIFFGRDNETDQVVNLVEESIDSGGKDVLMIHGSSGSGKSSFMRAGAISALKRMSSKFVVLDTFDPTVAVESNGSLLDGSNGFINNLNSLFIEYGVPQLENPGSNWAAQDWRNYQDKVIEKIDQLGQSLAAPGETWRRRGSQRHYNGRFLVIPIDQAESLVSEYEPLPTRRPDSEKLEFDRSFIQRIFEELITGQYPVFFVITITDAAIREVQRDYFRFGMIEKLFLDEVQDREAILEIIRRPALFLRSYDGLQIEDGTPKFPEKLADSIANDFLSSRGSTGLPLLSTLLRKMFEKREEYLSKGREPHLEKIYSEVGPIDSIVGHLLDEIRDEIYERNKKDFDLRDLSENLPSEDLVQINAAKAIEHTGDKELRKKGTAKGEIDDVDFIVLSIFRHFVRYDLDSRQLELADFVPLKTDKHLGQLLELFYAKRITVESEVYADIRIPVGSGSRLYRLSHKAIVDHITSTSYDAKRLTTHRTTLAQIESLASQFVKARAINAAVEPNLSNAQHSEFEESILKYELFDRKSEHANDVIELVKAFKSQAQSLDNMMKKLKSKLLAWRTYTAASVTLSVLLGALAAYLFTTADARVNGLVAEEERKAKLAAIPTLVRDMDRRINTYRAEGDYAVANFNSNVLSAIVTFLSENEAGSPNDILEMQSIADSQLDRSDRGGQQEPRKRELPRQFNSGPPSRILEGPDSILVFEDGVRLSEYSFSSAIDNEELLGPRRELLDVRTPKEKFLYSNRLNYFVTFEGHADLLFHDLTDKENVSSEGVVAAARGFRAADLVASEHQDRFALLHDTKHIEIFEVSNEAITSIFASASSTPNSQLPSSAPQSFDMSRSGKLLALSYAAGTTVGTYGRPYVVAENSDGTWSELVRMQGANSVLTHLVVDEDENELFGFTVDGTGCVWSLANDAACEEIFGSTRSPVSTILRLPENSGFGNMFITGHQDGSLQVWRHGRSTPTSSSRPVSSTSIRSLHFDAITRKLYVLRADNSYLQIAFPQEDQALDLSNVRQNKGEISRGEIAETIFVSSQTEPLILVRDVAENGVRSFLDFSTVSMTNVAHNFDQLNLCSPIQREVIETSEHFRAQALIESVDTTLCANNRP